MADEDKKEAPNLKEELEVRANRPPTAKDKATKWIEETSGTTKFWIRNTKSGTWTLIGP